MHLVLKLEPVQKAVLPFSYQSYLASAIYTVWGNWNPAMAEAVHDGNLFRNRIKLFGFSPLNSPQTEIVEGNRECGVEQGGDGLRFEGPTFCRVHSPLPEFIQSISQGVMEEGILRVGSAVFEVVGATHMPAPSFRQKMKWQPVRHASFVTSWKNRGDRIKRYAIPESPVEGQSAESLLIANLRHKWQRITDEGGRPDLAARWAGLPEDADKTTLLRWLDEQPLEIRLEETEKTRLHQVKETKVRSWRASAQIEAHPALQRLAWACGLGEMNSMGFGTIEAD